ncbi:MAG: methyltransferase domain-containing protein [Gallionellaceae bacterium]|nr:methyltransferase domain-containing protein [Gallionellaceae bacterium]
MVTQPQKHHPGEHLELGQFIPLVYHYHMLADQARMDAFREAIAVAVPPNSRVLELGGGTGILSFFAAQHAAKVWCVEINPDLVREARRILALNTGGERVEMIEADAFDYLPPEPVDVVICEMVHVGMLREKQIPVIESFKRRYQEKFGGMLPRFVPEGFIQAVQPVQQSFDFDGYYAPIPFFQQPTAQQPRTEDLGNPVAYQLSCYDGVLPATCSWQGAITIERSGQLNALRFITKNLLAIDEAKQRTIDWFSQYLVVPLPEPLMVEAGQQVTVSFAYQPGDPISALKPVATLNPSPPPNRL